MYTRFRALPMALSMSIATLLHSLVGPLVISCMPAARYVSAAGVVSMDSSMSGCPMNDQSMANEYCSAATAGPVMRMCVSRQRANFPPSM